MGGGSEAQIQSFLIVFSLSARGHDGVLGR